MNTTIDIKIGHTRVLLSEITDRGGLRVTISGLEHGIRKSIAIETADRDKLGDLAWTTQKELHFDIDDKSFKSDRITVEDLALNLALNQLDKLS